MEKKKNDNTWTTAAGKRSPSFQHRVCTLHAHKHDIDIDWFEGFYDGDFFLSAAVAVPLFSIPKGISLEPNTAPPQRSPSHTAPSASAA